MFIPVLWPLMSGELFGVDYGLEVPRFKESFSSDSLYQVLLVGPGEGEGSQLM